MNSAQLINQTSGAVEYYTPIGDELTRLRKRCEELERDRERLKQITPEPPKAIAWEQGVEILNVVQDICWPRTIDNAIQSHEPER